MSQSIGEKIKMLRIKLNLTQEELASRAELSKGFISQLERDLTSISVDTLDDILQCLGTNLRDFFNETEPEQVVYPKEDVFVKNQSDIGCEISWLVTNAQKNDLEPIMVDIIPGGRSMIYEPHEGEEFGYIISGNVTLHFGKETFKVRKGDSFNFKAKQEHYIENTGKVLWVSTPPTF